MLNWILIHFGLKEAPKKTKRDIAIHAKVLIVGLESVGKTCIVRYLQGNEELPLISMPTEGKRFFITLSLLYNKHKCI
jgi:GTPase SAR1 family protein